MPTILDCPSCSRKVRVPDDLMGKPVQCPTCQTVFEAGAAVPAVEEVERAPASLGREPDLDDELDLCPTCHKPVPDEADRCPHCGENLEVEDDDRPWDDPWPRVRRDCEPHRGGLVLACGIVSLVCAPLFWCSILGPIFSVVGLGTGITAWVLGVKDRKKIRAHIMDPRGESMTTSGMTCGIIGTVLCSIGLVIAILVVALWSAMFFAAPTPAAPPPPPPPTNVPKMLSRVLLPSSPHNLLSGNGC